MTGARGRWPGRRSLRIMVLIENVSFARDHRARKQAGTLLRAGYRVGVICRRDPENARYAAPGLRIYEYRPPPERPQKIFFLIEYLYSLTIAAFILVRASLHGRFDAIQAGDPPDISFMIGIPARLVGVRFVVDQRDLSPEMYADRYGVSSGFIPRVLRALERISWRTAEHIICVNRSLQSTIVTRGRVPSSKTTIVGNGPRLKAVARRAPRTELRGTHEHLVCWLGVMGPQDHIELVLEAIRYYVHELRRNDALFALIGDGESYEDLRRSSEALDISDHVRFTGWLDEDECFDHLAVAALGLDSNLQKEVTPVKGLEYLAHGVPFVAFDLPETRVMAGSAATYIPPGDAVAMAIEIARLLDDPERRTAMGAAGRVRIEREFAWESQERSFLEVYERLIGSPTRRTSNRAPTSAAASTVEILSGLSVAQGAPFDQAGPEHDGPTTRPVGSPLQPKRELAVGDVARVARDLVNGNGAAR